MIVLLDTSELVANAETEIGFECGELLTPLTRRAWEGRRYGIDNGAFSKFDAKDFLSLLDRQKPHQGQCLFVAVPDVVGSARRTLEVFRHWAPELAGAGWPLALVAQDGLEDLDVPWEQIAAVFVGGSTEWKIGRHAEAVVKAAKALGKWVHVGRVNTPERLDRVIAMGADSIDGTGISRFSWMRKNISEWADGAPLFQTANG